MISTFTALYETRYRIYVDILTREKLSSILLNNIEIICQFEHPVGEDVWCKGSLFLLKARDNLVKDPSNIKSTSILYNFDLNGSAPFSLKENYIILTPLVQKLHVLL